MESNDRSQQARAEEPIFDDEPLRKDSMRAARQPRGRARRRRHRRVSNESAVRSATPTGSNKSKTTIIAGIVGGCLFLGFVALWGLQVSIQNRRHNSLASHIGEYQTSSGLVDEVNEELPPLSVSGGFDDKHAVIVSCSMEPFEVKKKFCFLKLGDDGNTELHRWQKEGTRGWSDGRHDDIASTDAEVRTIVFVESRAENVGSYKTVFGGGAGAAWETIYRFTVIDRDEKRVIARLTLRAVAPESTKNKRGVTAGVGYRDFLKALSLMSESKP